MSSSPSRLPPHRVGHLGPPLAAYPIFSAFLFLRSLFFDSSRLVTNPQKPSCSPHYRRHTGQHRLLYTRSFPGLFHLLSSLHSSVLIFVQKRSVLSSCPDTPHIDGLRGIAHGRSSRTLPRNLPFASCHENGEHKKQHYTTTTITLCENNNDRDNDFVCATERYHRATQARVRAPAAVA